MLKIVGFESCRNTSEEAVAKALTGVFSERSGLLLIEPRLCTTTSFATDIFLCTPEVGAAVIEVKNHSIDQILEVSSGKFTVKYKGSLFNKKREKDPISQAENAMYTIKEAITPNTPLPLFTIRIALPNISEKEWIAKGFDKRLEPDIILLKDDIEDPSRLRKKIIGYSQRKSDELGYPLFSDPSAIEDIEEAFGIFEHTEESTQRPSAITTIGDLLEFDPLTSEDTEPVTPRITHKNPGLFIILIDQSGSMNRMNEKNERLSLLVARSINKFLDDLVRKCTRRPDAVEDYFDIAVIGYGNNNCRNCFQGPLGETLVNKISCIADKISGIEVIPSYKQKFDGSTVLVETKLPVWIKPVNSGNTPMNAAFANAIDIAQRWCATHNSSVPPMVINITDGEPNNGDPELLAEELKQIGTRYGSTLVYNVHITLLADISFAFTYREDVLPDNNAKRLFRMSSKLTPAMYYLAKEAGYQVTEESRGHFYNTDIATLVRFLEIGSTGVGI